MLPGASIIGISSLGAQRVLENYTLVGTSKAALEALDPLPRRRARAARHPRERRVGRGRRHRRARALPEPRGDAPHGREQPGGAAGQARGHRRGRHVPLLARGGDDPRPDADRRRRLLACECDGADRPQPPRVRRRPPHRRERPRNARDAGADPGAAARCERQPRPPSLLRHGPGVGRPGRAGGARHGRRRRRSARSRRRGGGNPSCPGCTPTSTRCRPSCCSAAGISSTSATGRSRACATSMRGPPASPRRCGAAACCCSTTSTRRALASTRSGAGETTTSPPGLGEVVTAVARRARLRGLEEWPGKDAKVPGHLVLAAEKRDA